MYKLLVACLALVVVVSCKDVIVGLKTDGTKFFDENRQANPALWRQMDNVTINAPENEVISRIVITDLRPEKDGDVKIVAGGDGHKNVTIELKSPTVLRGYEFHIEVFSLPESQSSVNTFDQQSTTENGHLDGSVKTTQSKADGTETKIDTTSESSDSSTLRNIPILLSNDAVNENDREGRGLNNEDKTSTQVTNDVTSTTVVNDISTTQDVTASDEGTSTANPKNDAYPSSLPPIPLIGNFYNPAVPILTASDVSNNKEERHARATDDKDSTQNEKSTDEKILTPAISLHKFETTTMNGEEQSTIVPSADEKTSEENTQAKQQGSNIPKIPSNRKYTSMIPSTPTHISIPVEAKDDEKQRNTRRVNDEHIVDSTSTTEIGESTTLSAQDVETSTGTNEGAHVTIGNQSQDGLTDNPIEIAKDIEKTEIHEGNGSPRLIPNYRHWNFHLNPTNTEAKSPDQKTDDLSVIPAILKDGTTIAPDTETMGNDFKPSPDHMEHKNDPKNKTQAAVKPVISLQ